MSFSDSIKICFAKYANFSGRATRSEYWWFYLFFIVGYAVFFILSGLSDIFVIPLVLFTLAILLPSLAAAVRRLHDFNKSGWFLLISIIPLVNLLLLYYLVQPGDVGDNQYGPPPAN